jgi:predicted permease
MIDVILQSGFLILCGVLWRIFKPLRLDADSLRRNLTGLVYVLLLPSLVLVVLWKAPLNLDAVRVTGVAVSGVLLGLVLAWLWYRRGKTTAPAVGALLLAAAFPNATYMGLPVLEASLGPWARSIAIQYDLFACTPLLLSLGILIASHYGGVKEEGHPLLALLRVPPLWAALAAVLLNLSGAPILSGVETTLDKLGSSVVPLMLFSLGLGLQWSDRWRQQFSSLVPVILLQLLITPLLMWRLAGQIGLKGDMLTGTVLEAAMPSMVLGIVLCDRFKLDSALYAMAVTLTTALSLLTLPMWFELLG